MRPSAPCRLVRTSGSIGFDANNGRSARSSGMLTSENAVTFCGLPSSNTWKSLALQTGDELAVAIEDARVDLDVVDLGAEGDRRLLRLLRLTLAVERA